MVDPWQRLPALSLKQIQYFVTLAQLRHFTETANQMAITQPALSSALRQIESLLGGKLFHRSAQAVTLTQLGEAILPHAKGLLNTAHAAFSDMQQIALKGGEGTLRIGLIPSASSLLFPDGIKAIAERFPHLRLAIQDYTNDALLQAVTEGAIDVGIGVKEPTLLEGVVCTPLLDDELVVVVLQGDPLAGESTIAWRALLNRDIALFGHGSIHRQVTGLAHSKLPTLTLKYRVDHLETLYGMVRTGLAVAILPRLYTTYLYDPAFRVVALQAPVVSRTLALISPANLVRTPQMEQVRDLLVAVITQQRAQQGS